MHCNIPAINTHCVNVWLDCVKEVLFLLQGNSFECIFLNIASLCHGQKTQMRRRHRHLTYVPSPPWQKQIVCSASAPQKELNQLLSQPWLKHYYTRSNYCLTFLLDCRMFCRCSCSVPYVYDTVEDLSSRSDMFQRKNVDQPVQNRKNPSICTISSPFSRASN